jgi:metal-sulfur cluster biosynthetic enzyme
MSFISDENKKELEIYDALKSVIDPEVGINIIDLGLVYKIKYDPTEGILIEMTLSSRACPMGNIILGRVEETAQTLFPEIKINIKLVWQPLWDPAFITPAGKKALNHL